MILLTFPFAEADGKGLSVSQHLFLRQLPGGIQK